MDISDMIKKKIAVLMVLLCLSAAMSVGCGYVKGTDISKLYEEKGYTIVNQRGRKVELNIGSDFLPDYTELGAIPKKTFKPQEVVVYSDDVSSIWLDTIKYGNTQGSSLCVQFNISYKLNDGYTALSLYEVIEHDDENSYKTALYLPLENTDVIISGIGPKQSFSVYINKEAYISAEDGISFDVNLNEISYYTKALPKDRWYKEGFYLKGKTSDLIIVENNAPIRITPDNDSITFDGLTDGDRIRVEVFLIEETYPAQAIIYDLIKLSDGTIEDINRDTLKLLNEMGWIEYSADTYFTRNGMIVNLPEFYSGKVSVTPESELPEDRRENIIAEVYRNASL